jgi:branched-chain amino acid transport system permease protein
MPIGHQILLGAMLGAMILFSPGGLLPALGSRLATVFARRGMQHSGHA